MSVYTKFPRVFARFYWSKNCSFGKFLNGQNVQGVQARREFHASHLSAVFAKELFVGNFVKPVGFRVQDVQVCSLENNLLEENLILRQELRKIHNVIQKSKIEIALCSTFGKLANDWSETVKQINDILDQQRKDYERRIEALEKTSEQLVKENEEMKKVIADFRKLEPEFGKQKRLLRLGQIAYQLETLVSEYVFPGDDKSSKKARYGTNLKSLKEKIGKLKDKSLRKAAMSRLTDLNEEMFEDWFLGMVKELKTGYLGTAHPKLGTYEEMRSLINEEFSDGNKREDVLTALERLQEMYEKLNRNFGE